jgi:hypothetical protein
MLAEIVTARHEHIMTIAMSVRDEDRREMFDYLLLSPTEALERSYAVSRLAWTGLLDNEPVCMFGVAPSSPLSDTGLVWMIGTTALDKHAPAFLRRNKKMVATMLSAYPRLENYVAEYNVKSIAWLKWLGFEFGEPEPIGLFKKLFIKFWKVADEGRR